MPIRVIHGSGDLIGGVFEGLRQSAQALTENRQRERALDDREERTEAYTQRIADATRLKEIELAMEQEERVGEQRREAAQTKAAMGLAQAEVGQLSKNPFWSKDDEAGLRAIFSDPDLGPKDKEDAAERYFEHITDRIEQQERQQDEMKVLDVLQRAQTPDVNGNAYITPDEAELYAQAIEAGEDPKNVFKELRKHVAAAKERAALEREMVRANTAIAQALEVEGLSDTDRESLDFLETDLLTGEITPGQARFRARAIAGGDAAELENFARLIVKAHSAPGSGAGAGAASMPNAQGAEGASAPRGLGGDGPDIRRYLADMPEHWTQYRKIQALEAWAQENDVSLEEIRDALRQSFQEQGSEARTPPPAAGIYSGDHGFEEAKDLRGLFPRKGPGYTGKALPGNL